MPERDPGVLGNVRGLEVVELGCGTAYFPAWLAKRGARQAGVDLTAVLQLTFPGRGDPEPAVTGYRAK